MLRQIVVGLAAGVVFLVLDGLVNANPLARQVYVAYQPIARTSVDAVAGSLIDLAYGLILVALFVTLRHCLPGRRDLMKGLSFGAMVWFLRVAMRVAGEWVVTTVPASAHAYTLLAGLVQTLTVAVVVALLLPRSHGDARREGGMIPELVRSFDRSLAYMRELVADLSDEDLILQPPGVPNHAAWTLGHVIHSCQAMAGELGVARWLPDDWEPRFGYGSTPCGTLAPQGSGKAPLLASLAAAGDRLRSALLDTDESRLREPLRDERAREALPTLGDALLQVVAAHTAFHAGQLAAWRRAIGRAPVGVFV